MKKTLCMFLFVSVAVSVLRVPVLADVSGIVHHEDFEEPSYAAGDLFGRDDNIQGTVITQSEAETIAPGTSSGQVVLFPESGGIVLHSIPESHGAPYTGDVVRVTHNIYVPTIPEGQVMPIYFYSPVESSSALNQITAIRITPAMGVQYNNSSGSTYATLPGASVNSGWNTIGIALIKETKGADNPFTKARFYLNDNWYEPSGQTIRYKSRLNFGAMAWQYPAGIAPMIDEIKVAELPSLEAVQSAALSDKGVAAFSPAVNDNAEAYAVRLYKDGNLFSTVTLLPSDNKSVDFFSEIVRGGTAVYTATVQAKGDWTSYVDSAEMAASGSYHANGYKASEVSYNTVDKTASVTIHRFGSEGAFGGYTLIGAVYNTDSGVMSSVNIDSFTEVDADQSAVLTVSTEAQEGKEVKIIKWADFENLTPIE